MSERKDNSEPAAVTALHAEVADRFGLLPNFFSLTPEAPEITASLWGFARFGYLDNPLPSLFKERLFVYLSRFCKVRYCITRHVAFLVGLGRPSGDRRCPPETVEQAVRLITRPLPEGPALDSEFAALPPSAVAPFSAPAPETPAERAIFVCASHVFLQTPDAARCLEALRRSFDSASLQHLMVFLAFVRTAHFWTMVHPELTFEDDADQLLATHEALAQCVMNDPEASASELSQVLLDELNTLRQSSRMLRERAETAGIAKDNFIATLSHELRTPLTPVLATLGAWERLPEFPDALRDDLEMVRRNVDLEARLIDDLLDLTRVAHGKLALNVEVLDARKLLESVVTMYRSEINAKQIDLVLAPQDERRYVLADPGRLQQAFWNLLKNAVKFSPERGRIEVSTRIDVPGQVQIMVRDEGIGIAPEMLARLFTPFEQESVEAIRHYGGLGLGLSITRKLIEAQGGSIAAQSEGKYRGATFVITLPCVEAPDEVGESAGNSGDGASAERRCLRVLLVEDHVDTARVLARLLRRTGHEVTTAHSVADAVGALTAAPFDVLVSDIGLPDGTGLDLIRQVRGQHGLTLPAVALTGFGMEEDLARCREAGFDAHLTKPVNLVKLEETVQRVAAGAEGIECK